MHPDILPLLRCPRSHLPLELAAATYRSGLVWNGTLRSAAGQAWSIRQGIIDLLDRPAAWNGAQIVNRLRLAAWGYERLWRGRALSLLSGRAFPLDEERALLVAQLAPERGGVYLDLACSTGVYGRALALALPADAGHVICLDHSTAMLRETQRNAAADGVPVTLVRALAEDLPFANGGLAGVACGGSFNEFTNRDRVLSEVRRTLQPAGRSFWMQARQAPTWAGRLLQLALRPGGVAFPAADELARSLAAAGLQVVFDQRSGAVQLVASRGHILAID